MRAKGATLPLATGAPPSAVDHRRHNSVENGSTVSGGDTSDGSSSVDNTEKKSRRSSKIISSLFSRSKNWNTLRIWISGIDGMFFRLFSWSHNDLHNHIIFFGYCNCIIVIIEVFDCLCISYQYRKLWFFVSNTIDNRFLSDLSIFPRRKQCTLSIYLIICNVNRT